MHLILKIKNKEIAIIKMTSPQIKLKQKQLKQIQKLHPASLVVPVIRLEKT